MVRISGECRGEVWQYGEWGNLISLQFEVHFAIYISVSRLPFEYGWFDNAILRHGIAHLYN